jgi:hypothetical protein
LWIAGLMLSDFEPGALAASKLDYQTARPGGRCWGMSSMVGLLVAGVCLFVPIVVSVALGTRAYHRAFFAFAGFFAMAALIAMINGVRAAVRSRR